MVRTIIESFDDAKHGLKWRTADCNGRVAYFVVVVELAFGEYTGVTECGHLALDHSRHPAGLV